MAAYLDRLDGWRNHEFDVAADRVAVNRSRPNKVEMLHNQDVRNPCGKGLCEFTASRGYR
jgi:hypothetical protein